MDEKQRWYMKFERLLRRVKKLGEGLAESSLSVEDKAEIWEFFWSFYSGIGKDLETRYRARALTVRINRSPSSTG